MVCCISSQCLCQIYQPHSILDNKQIKVQSTVIMIYNWYAIFEVINGLTILTTCYYRDGILFIDLICR